MACVYWCFYRTFHYLRLHVVLGCYWRQATTESARFCTTVYGRVVRVPGFPPSIAFMVRILRGQGHCVPVRIVRMCIIFFALPLPLARAHRSLFLSLPSTRPLPPNSIAATCTAAAVPPVWFFATLSDSPPTISPIRCHQTTVKIGRCRA